MFVIAMYLLLLTHIAVFALKPTLHVANIYTHTHTHARLAARITLKYGIGGQTRAKIIIINEWNVC